MGLKISTKIRDYDYPDEEKEIAYYGPHEVDIRPYIISFLIRTTMSLPPIDIDTFVKATMEMLDGCIRENGGEYPTYGETTLFMSYLKNKLILKMSEIQGSVLHKA
jgi:hypothetical protein